MKNKFEICILLFLGLILLSETLYAEAPNLISYQGRLLESDGTPLDTTVTITFSIYVDSTGGTALWTETQSTVSVENGLFQVLLGDIVTLPEDLFDSTNRWLGINVNGDGEMAPRSRIASVGYSLNSWSLTGNSGTSAGTNFIGTLDDNEFDIRVDNNRAFRFEPTGSGSAANLIGGYEGNLANSEVEGATIGGGGNNPYINQVTGDYGTIGGGSHNTSGSSAVVGGGSYNLATGMYASIGGGYGNKAEEYSSTVGGGFANKNMGKSSSIGGGLGNKIMSDYSTISGGGMSDPLDTLTCNLITDDYCTISGGGNNQAGNISGSKQDAFYATVSGGKNNIASGKYSFVAGGVDNNAAGDYSFSAGTRAKSLHNNCFVWSDKIDSDFQSTANEQFLIHASGGVGIGTNTPEEQLDVDGNIQLGGNLGEGLKFSGHSYKKLIMTGWDNDNWQDYISFYTPGNQSSNEHMRLRSDGRLGIGTTDPDEELHVEGTIEVDQKIQANDAGGLELATDDGNTRLFIKDDGNVGIGSSNPSAKLAINGGLHVGGDSDPGDNNLTVDGELNLVPTNISSSYPISSLHTTTSNSWVYLASCDINDQNEDRQVFLRVRIHAKTSTLNRYTIFIVRGLSYIGESGMTYVDEIKSSSPILGYTEFKNTSYEYKYLTFGPFNMYDNDKMRFWFYYRQRETATSYVDEIQCEIMDMQINF